MSTEAREVVLEAGVRAVSHEAGMLGTELASFPRALATEPSLQAQSVPPHDESPALSHMLCIHT